MYQGHYPPDMHAPGTKLHPSTNSAVDGAVGRMPTPRSGQPISTRHPRIARGPPFQTQRLPSTHPSSLSQFGNCHLRYLVDTISSMPCRTRRSRMLGEIERHTTSGNCEPPRHTPENCQPFRLLADQARRRAVLLLRLWAALCGKHRRGCCVGE
jgi:hypothetical protein